MPLSGSRAAPTPSIHVFFSVRAGSVFTEPRQACPSCRSASACLAHDRHGSNPPSASVCTALALPGPSGEPEFKCLPLAHGPCATGIDGFPPFVAAELQSLGDPLTMKASMYMGYTVQCTADSLPDNSIDSQAHLLRFIVDTIRTKGLRSAYYFRDRSPAELLSFLKRDNAFSNAMRALFDDDSRTFANALALIVRHVCRRPPSYKSRKSVHFSEVPLIITPEPTPEEHALDAGSPDPSLPPFDPEALLKLPNPVESKMASLALPMLLQAPDLIGCAEAEVQFVVLLCEVLQYQHVPTHLFSGLVESNLREVVHADSALMEHLQALLKTDGREFYHQLSLVVRYLCIPLMH